MITNHIIDALNNRMPSYATFLLLCTSPQHFFASINGEQKVYTWMRPLAADFSSGAFLQKLPTTRRQFLKGSFSFVILGIHSRVEQSLHFFLTIISQVIPSKTSETTLRRCVCVPLLWPPARSQPATRSTKIKLGWASWKRCWCQKAN